MKKFISVLLAVTICFAFGVSAFAKESPTAEEYYSVQVSTAVAGAGTAVAVPSVATSGEIVTLTAVAAEGYVFDHWELDGCFEIVEGTIYDPVIKVRVVPGVDDNTHGSIDGTAEVKGIAYFRAVSSEVTTGEQQTAKPDVSPDAPQTGTLSTQAVVVVMLSIVGLMAVAFIYKKRCAKTK